MGTFDDVLAESFEGLPAGRSRRRPAPVPTDYSKVDWTTKDGQTLLVADMEASHRQNCLNVLVRRHGKAKVLDSRIGKAFLFYGAKMRED